MKIGWKSFFLRSFHLGGFPFPILDFLTYSSQGLTYETLLILHRVTCETRQKELTGYGNIDFFFSKVPFNVCTKISQH